MERAPDLEQAVRDFYSALGSGNAASAASMVSSSEACLWIGTDPGEWWEGADRARTAISTQVGEMKEAGISISGGNPKAWRSGDVGWFVDQASFKLPDGNSVPVRITALCQKEDGAWKFVQAHASVGVANEETVGEELTV
ncbi:MAG TPA: nuclear transport factor 2 family protein [Actinomycetota bacterium]|nr:nuclear transport factor 2 family protein [Actinomycetota bacterium]